MKLLWKITPSWGSTLGEHAYFIIFWSIVPFCLALSSTTNTIKLIDILANIGIPIEGVFRWLFQALVLMLDIMVMVSCAVVFASIAGVKLLLNKEFSSTLPNYIKRTIERKNYIAIFCYILVACSLAYASYNISLGGGSLFVTDKANVLDLEKIISKENTNIKNEQKRIDKTYSVANINKRIANIKPELKKAERELSFCKSQGLSCPTWKAKRNKLIKELEKLEKDKAFNQEQIKSRTKAIVKQSDNYIKEAKAKQSLQNAKLESDLIIIKFITICFTLIIMGVSILGFLTAPQQDIINATDDIEAISSMHYEKQESLKRVKGRVIKDIEKGESKPMPIMSVKEKTDLTKKPTIKTLPIPECTQENEQKKPEPMSELKNNNEKLKKSEVKPEDTKKEHSFKNGIGEVKKPIKTPKVDKARKVSSEAKEKAKEKWYDWTKQYYKKNGKMPSVRDMRECEHCKPIARGDLLSVSTTHGYQKRFEERLREEGIIKS